MIYSGIHTFTQKESRLKRVITKMCYFPQSKDSISLEVAVETKLLLDSALGQILYAIVDTLQICAVKLQWKCIEKTVILTNYSFLLLTIVRCIFYKFSLFSRIQQKKTVKIKKIAKIHLFLSLSI